MSKVIIASEYLDQLVGLDAGIRSLNEEKIRLLFELLAIPISPNDFELLIKWELILVTVPDKQMAVQLNKLSAYVPNLKFVVDAEQPTFSLLQGKKPRRVWKER